VSLTLQLTYWKDLNTIASYIVPMVTSIQVSEELLDKLKTCKMYDKESYEEVIWDLFEDTLELSEETKRHIKIAEKEIKEGKVVTLDQIKKNVGL